MLYCGPVKRIHAVYTGLTELYKEHPFFFKVVIGVGLFVLLFLSWYSSFAITGPYDFDGIKELIFVSEWWGIALFFFSLGIFAMFLACLYEYTMWEHRYTLLEVKYSTLENEYGENKKRNVQLMPTVVEEVSSITRGNSQRTFHQEFILEKFPHLFTREKDRAKELYILSLKCRDDNSLLEAKRICQTLLSKLEALYPKSKKKSLRDDDSWNRLVEILNRDGILETDLGLCDEQLAGLAGCAFLKTYE